MLGILAVAGLVLVSGTRAFAEDYRLGPQDKLTIRVAEWSVSEGKLLDWPSISGEYSVGPEGTISVPFVGDLVAEKRTTAEISRELGQSLKKRFGLSQAPEAAVEVLQFRPFFITGTVRTPGQYPFMPGLTVIKAVSVAGGNSRDPEQWQRAERDYINAKSGYDILADERARLLIKRERLAAESAGKTDFELPKELQPAKRFEAIMADEKAILRVRQKKLSLRLQALSDLKQLLEKEVASLEQKRGTQGRQVELARQELRGIDKLAEQGLVANQRRLDAERSIANMESQLLDLETAMLRAKQDINKSEQDAVDLKNTDDAQLAEDRQTTEAELDSRELKLTMQRGLMGEAITAGSAEVNLQRSLVRWTYKVIRMEENGSSRRFMADENTLVAPGDVVEVSSDTDAGE